MAKFQFVDNTIQVQNAIEGAITQFLTEASAELAAQTAKNTSVDTGQLKGSWTYKVNAAKKEATIGSPLQNAIWEEFGTGEHALQGGRKTPWFVPVAGYKGKKKPTYQGKVVIVYGKNKKKYYMTDGKKPRRNLFNAYKSTKDKIIKRAEQVLKTELD